MATNSQITCLCGAVREEGSLLAKPLPIRGAVDHCTDCRYSTGVLFHTAAPLKGPPSPNSIASCTVYASSSKLSRYFCSTCGTPCFLGNTGEDKWSVRTGVIEPRPGTKGEPDVFIPVRHYFVGDSIDYKMASRLLMVDGHEMPIRHGDDVGPPVLRDEILRISGKTSSSRLDQLRARCHYSNTDLRITRPYWEQEEEDIPSIVTPEPYKHKYRASFYVCRFYRLAVGDASFTP
jgi:hypothetical protein